jgi:peroxiredoxin Q/BCP
MVKSSQYLAIFIISFFFTCKGYSQMLKVGSKVPEFKLLNQDGTDFDIKDVLGKENLVVYFYPKDDSPGCTKEACSFRDQYESFKEANAKVIGISGQSVESHKEFAEKYKLPFTLLSDKDNSVRKLFGVRTGPIPGRVTFVVDKTGTVVYTFESLMDANKHVEEAMRILKDMK